MRYICRYFIRLFYSFSLFLSFHTLIFGQQRNIGKIDTYLENKQIIEAERLWYQDVGTLESAGEFDSLHRYILPFGRILLAKTSPTEGKQRMLDFIAKILGNTSNNNTIAYSYVYLAKYFEWIADFEESYRTYGLAYGYVKKLNQPDFDWQCTLQNNLSIIASRLNRMQESKMHLDTALFVLSDKKEHIQPNTTFQIYNAVGARYYYSANYDSSLHYFNKAYQTCRLLDSTARSRLYRPSIILNNMAGIYPEIGEIGKAIETQKKAIDLINQYLKESQGIEYKDDAREFLSQQIDNLAGLNKRIGNYKEAERLLLIAYDLKRHKKSPAPLEVAISEILLGQVYYDLRQDYRSESFLNTGLQKLSDKNDSYSLWKATAYHFLALLAERKNRLTLANDYYQMAASFYEQTFDDYYDESYLEFSKNLSEFYAKTNRSKEAISIAERAYRYVLKYQSGLNVASIRHSLNLASIHLEGKDYKAAVQFAKRGLSYAERLNLGSTSLMDSVLAIREVPGGMLIKAKAEYAMLDKKNKNAIQYLITQLEEAIKLIESQKVIMTDREDARILVTNSKHIYDFIKQVYLDLYQITREDWIIGEILKYHEEALYTRIRDRINRQEIANFKGVTSELLAQEKMLESLLKKTITPDLSKNSDDYLALKQKQVDLKRHIELNYPDYYRIRYNNFNDDLQKIQERLKPEVTVIRYVYFGKHMLAAIVFDKKKCSIVELGPPPDESLIRLPFDPGVTAGELSQTLWELYQKLWQPLESFIANKKVIVVPDGALFNLSFELLTPKRIDDYKELVASSLLNQYGISYSFSASGVGRSFTPTIAPKKEMIAFVPGFTEEMKEHYVRNIKDTIYLDQSYLTLLPQPFSLQQVRKIRSIFQSTVFSEEVCTIDNFKRQTGDHAIIHLGTHAEANNVSAEFSKLIFAKDRNNYLNPNFLYLTDIYGCNLNSYLTVLTACETGVPGYQDGEGMISMAHAFHYAGSNSILTSLSKIDEQTSNVIVGYFYEFLANGLEIDAALQKAKLRYLESNDGRLLQPHYWAALVIMGDTAPITIKKRYATWTILLLISLFIVSAGVYYRFRGKKQSEI